MLNYLNTKDKSKTLAILDPSPNSSKFPIKQKMIGELSGGANLSGKADKRIQTSWPGNMSGVDVIKFMIKKAGKTKGGVDTRNGINYTQLISKYTMGAVLYHQACDNYLDEKMKPVSNQKAQEIIDPIEKSEQVRVCIAEIVTIIVSSTLFDCMRPYCT